VNFAERMPRSLGAKRNEIPPSQIGAICTIHREFRDGAHSKILHNEDFGYRRITIERPLRLNFQMSPERLLPAQYKFTPAAREALASMDPNIVYRDQAAFDTALKEWFGRAGVKLGRTLSRRIREALSAPDNRAAAYHDAKGRPEPDPELRDHDDVPLNVPVNHDMQAWFDREVLPHAPDAWFVLAESRIGYAIPFARFFYEPEPVRSLGEIDQEIRGLEQETQALLAKIESA